MRNTNISFVVALILISECIVEGAPRIPLPFLRGGSATTAAATRTRAVKKQKLVRRKRHNGGGIHPVRLASNVKQGLDKLGGKIQHDTVNIGKNIGRELGKLTTHTRNFVAKIIPHRRKHLKASKLDEVCNTFASVLKGNEVDTAQLIKACKAHTSLMKTGGSSLRMVAKDLESNVQKAERVFKKSPKEHKCLSSLLQCEKDKGIHSGSELNEKSAAMGLLWIRRSLAFQLDLYSSLIYNELHPREAAYNAYAKHLSPFHGWALRKVFPASLSQMPDRQVFMAKFGGIKTEELNDEYDRMIAKKLKTLVGTWDPLLSSWREEYERLDLEDVRRV